MADANFMSEPTFAQADSGVLQDEPQNFELLRNNHRSRLHSKRTEEASIHPRAASVQDSSACCELYSRVDHHYLPLSGEWLPNAGFINGMPVKIRVMKDCIVITPQHTRELWGCLEGMSVVNINKQKVSQWLKTFPGALNDLGDEPVIKRRR